MKVPLLPLLPLLATITSAHKPSVVQVQALCRHGLRTPFDRAGYPTDPHSELVWENGSGNLVPAGVRGMYQLGAWLRSRYGALLGSSGSCDGLKVFSSNTNRTLQSAQGMLLGLRDSDYTGGLLTPEQAIPCADTLTAWPKQDDFMLIMLNFGAELETRCPPLLHGLTEQLESVEPETVSQLKRVLQQHARIPEPSFLDVVLVANTLSVQRSLGLLVPDWSLQSLPGTAYPTVLAGMKSMFNLRMKMGGSPALRRLSVGAMMRVLLDTMRNEPSEGGPGVAVYSAHGPVMGGLSAALDLPADLVPTSSCMLFELHEAADGGRGVCLLLRHGNRGDVRELDLGCSRHPCPLEELEGLGWVPSSVEEVRRECQAI